MLSNPDKGSSSLWEKPDGRFITSSVCCHNKILAQRHCPPLHLIGPGLGNLSQLQGPQGARYLANLEVRQASVGSLLIPSQGTVEHVPRPRDPCLPDAICLSRMTMPTIFT